LRSCEAAMHDNIGVINIAADNTDF